MSAITEGGKVFSTTSYKDMRSLLLDPNIVLVIHNGIRFDKVVLEKLLNIKIKCKIIDSLALSWYLFPKRGKHGLEAWGEHYGVEKPFIQDWENVSVKEAIHRCEEDVKINLKLWRDQYKYLLQLYGTNKKIFDFLDYFMMKMECIALQEKSGWLVDVEYAQNALDKLIEERDKKIGILAASMPKVPVKGVKNPPKNKYKKDETPTNTFVKWLVFLDEQGLPHDHNEPVEYIKGYLDPNPASVSQLKDWLFTLGWEPSTFDVKKNPETGETRKIPKINLDQGKGICNSIKNLFKDHPELEVLEGLSVLNHRIPALGNIIRSVNEENYTKAQIQGITNTLRFRHRTLVNLPNAEKPFAGAIRESLISPKGYELCGSDMSSLEDRIKMHYIFKHDPDYVREMSRDDYDPHLTLALFAGAINQEDYDGYVSDDHDTVVRIKPIRSIYKNGNYACQYGAGIPRLVITCGCDNATATRVHKAYWGKNWAIEAVVKEQEWKTEVDPVSGEEQMWLKNPVNGFWYSLRSLKDIFSTLVQGTASYVFDLWVFEILKERNQLTGQFHDEIILTIKENSREKCKELLTKAINNVNKVINFNRELAVDVQFGHRYSEIH